MSNQTQYETPIWRLDLCDFRCTYIVVKETISVTDPNYDMTRNYLLKNNVPFISCISKINNTLIDKAKDLNIVSILI